MAMDPLMTSVAQAVRRRAGSGVGPPDDPDTELSSLGLTSLGVAGLLVDLEAAFSLEFPADTVTPEVFRTIRTLTDAVRTLLTPSPN
ncbi:phosphopantetheine-binding protein [Streptomyces sp. NPDC060000]|uniref:phosphopantetheine-binding protein n=1 Tax=Streptomyces sp. NPDC060000 TaxID=3347031 RepID=UPI00368547FC